MRRISEAERVQRGSIALAMTAAALTCSFLEWYWVAVITGWFFLWNLGRFIFMTPEPPGSIFRMKDQ